MKKNQTLKICLLVFVFLFAFSIGAQSIRSQIEHEREQANNPVTQYLREYYGVNSIDEYQAKLEQEAGLNYANFIKQFSNEEWFNDWKQRLPEANQYGTSTYQPLSIQTQTYPWWTDLANVNPFVELSVFSMSGLSFIAMLMIPKFGKKLLQKKWLVGIVIVAFVFYAGFMFGKAVASSSFPPNLYFDSLPSTASYVVETDGTYVWAVRSDGKIAYGGANNAGGVSGTDASAVIQACINSLTSGRIILKDVSLPSSITLKEDVIIEEQFDKTISFYQLNQPTFSIPNTLDDGLLLYMPFENVGNKAVDLSEYNNEGIINGANLTVGKIGNALSFDGVDDYVKILDSNSLKSSNSVTIIAWVKPTPPHQQGYGGIIHNINGKSGSRLLVSDDGIPRAQVYIGGAYQTVLGPSVTNGEWNFIVYVYDGSQEFWVVNGVKGNTYPKTGTIDTGTNDHTIGWGVSLIDYYHFKGSIDEMRIYNRALTVEEIKRLYLSSALKHGTSDVVNAKLERNDIVESSYIIFKKDSKIFAMNGKTGVIDYFGTNASEVIQSAIDALGVIGGKIFIKSGVYTINQTIKVGAQVALEGEIIGYQSSPLSTVLALADNANVKLLEAKGEDTNGQSRNIQLRNIWFTGNGDDQTAEVDMVDLTKGRAVIIDGCYFSDAKRDALIVTYAWILNSRFMNIGRYGIYAICDNYIAFNNFAGCVADNAYAGWSSAAIWLGDCNHVVSNDIYLATYGSGIIAYNGWENRIIGNRVSHNQRIGIGLHDTGSTWNIVLGNLVFNNGGLAANEYSGIYISGGASDNLIIGNQCYDYRDPKLQKYGIEEVGTSNYNIIVNNNVRGNLAGGIAKVGANTIVKGNLGYITENSGTATFNGDGTTKVFSIAHGLAGTPKSWHVEAGSNDAKGDKYVTANATNLTVTFATAPPAGTNNVVLVWSAEM